MGWQDIDGELVNAWGIEQAEGFGQPVQLVKTAGGREVADIYGTYLTKLLKAAR